MLSVRKPEDGLRASGALGVRDGGLGVMRILPDDCVPWPLRHLLSGHECMTAGYLGWGGSSNGPSGAGERSSAAAFLSEFTVPSGSRRLRGYAA